MDKYLSVIAFSAFRCHTVFQKLYWDVLQTPSDSPIWMYNSVVFIMFIEFCNSVKKRDILYHSCFCEASYFLHFGGKAVHSSSIIHQFWEYRQKRDFGFVLVEWRYWFQLWACGGIGYPGGIWRYESREISGQEINICESAVHRWYRNHHRSCRSSLWFLLLLWNISILQKINNCVSSSHIFQMLVSYFFLFIKTLQTQVKPPVHPSPVLSSFLLLSSTVQNV